MCIIVLKVNEENNSFGRKYFDIIKITKIYLYKSSTFSRRAL